MKTNMSLLISIIEENVRKHRYLFNLSRLRVICSGEMVLLCKYNISLGWVDIAVEFDLMSVNPSNCKTESSTWRIEIRPSLGYSSKEDFSFIKNVNQAKWGCGVVDSISGYEPLDPGSNPGTLAGLIISQGML